MTTPATTPQHPPENEDSDPDTEAKLAQMFEITNLIADLEEQRIRLRSDLVLQMEGSRYFLDPATGKKKYGYVVQPEPVEVDLDELKRLVPEATVTEILKEPKPPEVDKAKFKKAVETGRIPAEIFVQVAKMKKGNPHIRFGEPYGPPPVR